MAQAGAAYNFYGVLRLGNLAAAATALGSTATMALA